MNSSIKPLKDLAQHIDKLNLVMGDIFEIIGESCEKGHIGEYIASKIFDIELCVKKNVRRIDGVFNSGKLTGKSVNIKFYPKREGILDLPTSGPDPPPPDYYLVMTGPIGTQNKKEPRPWVIDAVYLFDAQKIVEDLRKRNRRVGTASSILDELWFEAEVYPHNRRTLISLNEEQRNMLRLFRSK